MHKFRTTTALLALAAAGSAQAGGVERSNQSVGILFEEGNRVELSFSHVSPEVSGNLILPGGGTGPSSGDMSEDYSTVSFGLKQQVNEQVSLALIVDQPIGADVAYPAGTTYPYTGSTAEIDSADVTALGKYTFPSNVSVFGGVRGVQSAGNVLIPVAGNYQMNTSTELDYGYVVGAAYERPEIGMRVALTYNSEITHDFTANESISPVPTEFSTTIPQSVNLEAQTGIAPDTLLFGSVRWVDWTSFEIAPPAFAAATGGGTLVDYEDDTFTYSLGLGRRFNESWSGAILASYEPQTGGIAGNLGPTDGRTSVGVALTYETGAYEVTGGLRYISIGDAEAPPPAPGAAPPQFNDNHAVAGGLQVAIKF